MDLANALLLANNSQACFEHTDVYTVSEKGVIIHKIDFVSAWRQATILEPALKASDIPLTFGMGCYMVEGLGDPNCINENIGFNSDGTPRSNEGKNDRADFDLGGCQLKADYLISPHLAQTIDEAFAFALNPQSAIPYFSSLVAGNIEWAKRLIATTPSPEPRYKDPLMVATGAYNEGRAGFVKRYYTLGVWLHHCTSVQDWERWYALHLGLTPIY